MSFNTIILTLLLVVQWVGDGDKKPVLMKIDTVKGSSLAMEIIKPINHSDKMTGVDVGDAVIEWR